MSFGKVYQHLLHRGQISFADLQRVMAYQREHQPHPSHYAIRLGFIGEVEARRGRAAATMLNVPFLRAATELELMTQEQIEAVREARNSDAVRLGDRLVALGLLSREAFTEALRELMDEQVRFAESAMRLPADVPERGAILRVFEAAGDMFERYWEMDVMGLGFEVRTDELPLDRHSAEVRFAGDVRFRFYVGVGAECADGAALALLGAQLTDDAERDDLVRELANVSCGHAAGTLAGQGKRVQLQPPCSVKSPVSLDERAVTLGLMTPFGPATLAVAF